MRDQWERQWVGQMQAPHWGAGRGQRRAAHSVLQPPCRGVLAAGPWAGAGHHPMSSSLLCRLKTTHRLLTRPLKLQSPWHRNFQTITKKGAAVPLPMAECPCSLSYPLGSFRLFPKHC